MVSTIGYHHFDKETDDTPANLVDFMSTCKNMVMIVDFNSKHMGIEGEDSCN